MRNKNVVFCETQLIAAEAPVCSRFSQPLLLSRFNTRNVCENGVFYHMVSPF